MKISDYLSKKNIKVGIESTNKKDAIAELVDVLEKAGKISDKSSVLKALMDREELGTTGIGQGIAIPHAKTDLVEDICVAIGISKKGISFSSLDGELVYVMFVFLAPHNSAGKHLKILALASQLLKDKYFREPLKQMESADDILKMIKKEE
jgi:fructose-specific phosphotransferase system IIA component